LSEQKVGKLHNDVTHNIIYANQNTCSV